VVAIAKSKAVTEINPGGGLLPSTGLTSAGQSDAEQLAVYGLAIFERVSIAVWASERGSVTPPVGAFSATKFA
jgi:hypothetical protein